MVENKPSKGCVIVLHEVWGLVPHVMDVCKRLGKLGFTAVAPNLYWQHEGLLVPRKISQAMKGIWHLSLKERYDLDKVKEAMTEKGFSDETLRVITTLYDPAFRDQMLNDAIMCARRAHSRYGAVGSVGFCMGGGLSARLATTFPDLRSCVVFYGEPPPPSEIKKIVCPVLMIHAIHDELINSKLPSFIRGALRSGKDLTLRIYPNTRHGFFNDTKKQLYNKEAAEDAWELTKWHLQRTMAKEHRSN